MKKTVIISIFAVLGLIAGYFAAPIASIWHIQSNEPDMYGASSLFLVQNFITCHCSNQPPSESVPEVSKDLSMLQRWRNQNPNSQILGQDIGMAYIRLAELEMELGRNLQSNQDLEHGQHELAALGWKDVSAAHLSNLIAQLDSEYKEFPAKTKAVTAAQ
jgi:hypothetical protein